MKPLLVVHPGALGDGVIAFPALLRLARQGAGITLIAGGGWGPIAPACAVVQRHLRLDSPAVSALLAGIPHPAADGLIDPESTALILTDSEAFRDGLGRRLGPDRIHCLPFRPPEGKPIHAADHLTDGLVRCGKDLRCVRERPPRFPNILETSEVFFDRRSAEFDPRRVLIHPGSGSPLKNWPPKHFARLARRLRDAGYDPALLLGPAEADPPADLVAETAAVHRLESSEALVTLLQKSGGLIGNDSGVAHLAAFLGLATVAIFGPSDPVRWAPRGRRVAFIGPAGDCPPCFERADRGCPERPCLTRTSPETVFKAAMALLA